MYRADPNDNTKQIPNSVPQSSYGKAIAPAPRVNQDRPHYVLLNSSGSYAFAYASGSKDTYVTGSKLEKSGAGPVRLDINPVAWRRIDGTNAGVAGDVSFIYLGNVG